MGWHGIEQVVMVLSYCKAVDSHVITTYNNIYYMREAVSLTGHMAIDGMLHY